MSLTADKGREIRKEYSETKEKEVCESFGLIQVGGSRTKVDGEDNNRKVSIKNFSGVSTQVHLTTQNHFIKTLGLNENCSEFIRLFCGSDIINVNGRDRYQINEIDNIYVESFLDFLNQNKIKIVDLILRNGFDIDSVIYRDLKTNIIRTVDYEDIIKKVDECSWVPKKGGIHLKNSNGKSYFHFQREGKRNKSNRYNVLWHIHRHLFLEN